MFIFRWLTRIVAGLGFVMAIVLAYFAFNPKTVEAKELDISLKEIYNCEAKQISSNDSLLDDAEIQEILTQVGPNIPTNIIKDLGGDLDGINRTIGTKSKIEITYCDVSSEADAIAKAKSFFSSRDKEYDYGSIEDLVDGINKVPFLKFEIKDFTIPSLFVKTNQCYKPINNSDLYFFGQGQIDSKKNMILVKVNMEDDEETSLHKRSLGNLIKTGQYFKSKSSKCNG